MIWTAAFWKGAGERALKSFCQGLVTALVVGGTVDIAGADWKLVVLTAAGMAVASFLTSVGNADFTAGDVKKPDEPQA
jgi:hypothetical protein